MNNELNEENGKVVRVSIDHKEWNDLMERVHAVELGLSGIKLSFKVIGGMLGTLLGGAITVGIIIWTSFASDRRMFIETQREDRMYMVEISKQLALTQKDFTNFAAAGPRYSSDMAERDRMSLRAELQEWVRANYPPKQLSEIITAHEQRIQALEKGKHSP